MSSYTLQILILAAAYVVTVVAGAGNGLLSLYNWRLMSRIEGRKDLVTRVMRVENELSSYRELLDTFTKRFNRREARVGKRSSGATDASGPGTDEDVPLTPEEILRRFHAGQLH